MVRFFWRSNMRKISGMYGVVLLLLICFSGGYFSSFFKPHSEAAAAGAKVPLTCPRWTCKNVSAVWMDNTNAAIAFFDENKNSITYAVQDLYATGSNEDLPVESVDMTPVVANTYKVCDPTCGYDPGTTIWQAPQEVSIPKGAGPTLIVSFGNLKQCFGGPGVESKTKNSNTAIPPGWKSEI